MTGLDWTIIAIYVVGVFAVGVYFTRRGSKGTEEFFVAGRTLPWFIAGTSMVATTFSSDTPLFIAGAARDGGIATNWIWWSAAPAALATVFFFAHLWRRSGAVTEIEFVAIRYDKSRAVGGLRVLRAMNDGLLTNCIIMSSVTLAMAKVLAVILELPDQPLFEAGAFSVSPTLAIVVVLGVVAVAYTALSGLFGVVYTDLVQFVIAMLGAFLLAIIVYVDLSGGDGFLHNLQAAPAYADSKIAVIPALDELNLDVATFLILITVGWIGMAPGSGHFVQRMLATRTERDAMLSMYWYAFANYLLRSWPWIIVGIASLVYFPELDDPEQAYPAMIKEFLPAGLKGVVVASLLAAFMSTLDTHLNWGCSYLINDVYQPYVAPGRASRHYVACARICMISLALVAIGIATQLESILSVYKFLAVMGAGNAFVVITRWYWWRINVWSEISSILSSLIVGVGLFHWVPDTAGSDLFAVRLALNTTVTTVVCLLVTMVTSGSEPTEQALAFYRRMRIRGRGWKKVRDLTGFDAEARDLAHNFRAWISSVVLLYALLFATGAALFHQWTRAAVLAAVAVIAAYFSNVGARRIVERLRRSDAIADVAGGRSGATVTPERGGLS